MREGGGVAVNLQGDSTPSSAPKVWVGLAGNQELGLCASRGIPSKKGVIGCIVTGNGD